MPKPKLWARLATLAAAAALVGADRWIKGRMSDAVTGRVLWPGVAGLRYTENTGISFSFFGESREAMLVVSALTALVMLVGIAAVLLGRVGGAAPLCATALILAGGVGNLADRLLHGFVVDYIELLFVRFAIFNFADVCITCGVALFTGWLLWTESRRRKRVNAHG
ncbi:MAG: signal peptidase II [Oscillospiraceae bacterium]|nr:signal peptidase II [Oscillospiraceae bacterium]